MQAEYNRGNGFIVSPLPVPFTAEKPQKKFKPEKAKRNIFIGECIQDLFASVRGEWTFVKKAVLKTVASLVLVCGCVIAFNNYFTVGTAIYKGNDLIAYSFSEDDYHIALLSASEYSREISSENDLVRLRTVPALTLRCNVSDTDSLRDKLLASTGKFDYGCILYSGSEAIFTAESEAVARQIVNEYISSYSMDGQASTNADLTYKTALIPISEINNPQNCLSLLSGSESVPVVSVVSTFQEKEIPFETRTEYDNNLYIGESVTVTEGKTGSAEIASQEIYKNGEFEKSQILSENIVATPVTQVVRVGTKPKDVLNSGLLYPLSGTQSSPFGERWGKMHEGIDIAVPIGTSVKAAECGTIIFAGDGGSYGNLVKIDHGNGVVTAYAHLDSVSVSKGQAVNSDTEIAKSGNTGRSTGPHLHFEVVKDGVPLDPNKYLKKR